MVFVFFFVVKVLRSNNDERAIKTSQIATKTILVPIGRTFQTFKMINNAYNKIHNTFMYFCHDFIIDLLFTIRNFYNFNVKREKWGVINSNTQAVDTIFVSRFFSLTFCASHSSNLIWEVWHWHVFQFKISTLCHSKSRLCWN